MNVMVLTLLALLTGGCATIMDGGTQAVSFQSNPEEVLATLVTRERSGDPENPVWHDEFRVLGKTPLTVQLDRGAGKSVVFSKPGYKPLTLQLTTGTNPNFWGNILLGGFFGSTTDSVSGAMTQYEPSQYLLSLVPAASTPIDAATQNGAREKAKEFIVRRYTNIMADLSRGTGEDLRATFQLLHIQPDQEAEALRKMRALAQVYLDAAIYATRVIELYLQ